MSLFKRTIKPKRSNSAESRKTSLHFNTLIQAGALLIVVMCFILIFHKAHKYSQPVIIEDIPLVKSRSCNIRNLPNSPGGMIIPHQEKSIYNNINNNAEHIKQKDETVTAKPQDSIGPLRQLLPDNKAPEIDVTQNQKILNISKDVITDTPPLVEKGTLRSNASNASNALSHHSTQQESEPNVFSVIDTDKVSILLGTTGTRAAAENKWLRLTKQYPRLKQYTHTIKMIRNEHATRYQISTQKEIQPEDAGAICDLLQQHQEDCLIEQ